ncbi:AMP-binding protein [Marichromatium sp. AB31]|uniref:AMP-binding protein n=1 Tax=Marichromatium sp. AB31 TaxID=2483362 RepID=UPI000F3DD549|nr:AMP-binding protein [Marichromatium sp. AB31]RNE90109.1 AMP-binding protein [Marichromatium sp. AB31]
MDQLRRSYVHGTATQTLQGMTVGDCLRRLAETRPDGLALVDRGRDARLDWRGLDARVDRLAAGLLELGFVAGDRIAVCTGNRIEWTLVQLATARLGMILVSLNPALRPAELERALALVGARALVVEQRIRETDYPPLLAELLPELATAGEAPLAAQALPALERVIRLDDEAWPGTVAFSTLLVEPAPETLERVRALAAAVDPDDPVNIQFSNATGGPPAGATLTHHNIVNNGLMVGRQLGLGAADRVCIPVPLYHCFGMVMGNMACLLHGSAMVYPGPGFDPLATLEAVAAESCTALYGVPAMFKAMLDHPRAETFDPGRLRTGIMAGAPCPPETMDRVRRRLGMAEVTIAYGMTESSPVSFMSAPDDPVERRLQTVGRIGPHLEAKVIDDAGRIRPVGEPGELCVRGYSLMRGYWDDPELTARVIDEAGWLHTGDLAVLDAEGYCRIVGGVKDTIIRGGENIHPEEVERFLETHPAVRAAVVVGVPDARLGEVVCACVELQPGASLEPEALREYCKDQIAYFKVPRYVRLYPRLPRSTGRALKTMLREQSIAALGRAEETG